jgi:hypothetical protein
MMTDDELWDALEGIYAYDMGCVDSGIHDEALKRRCREELDRRKQELLHEREVPGPKRTADRRFWAERLGDMYLSDEAIDQGYGVDDVVEFVNWLGREMFYDLG